MPHRIMIFSGGCSLCQAAVDMVELGKCKDCEMEVLDAGAKENSPLMRKFGIAVVPSIVVDEKIKVVGLPNFPWFCGDDFYRMLEKRYALESRLTH